MKKRNLNWHMLALGAAVAVFIFSALPVQAASFYFYPTQGTFQKNSNFKVSVMIKSDQAVNGVRGTVNFPTEYLEVLSLDRNSIVDFWVQKPSFSNAGETGNVYFEGITMNPGYTGEAGKILDITFRVKNTGRAQVMLSDFSILANDGKGTNISTPNGAAEFELVPASAEAPAGTGASTAAASPSEAIRAVEEKLDQVQDRINDMTHFSEPAETAVVAWWDVIPSWVRLGIIAFVGAAAFILAVIVFSAGLLVVIWMFYYALRGRENIFRFSRKELKSVLRFFRKMFFWSRAKEAELENDGRYTARQFSAAVKEAESNVPLSQLLRDYGSFLKRISRRFGKNKPK